MFLPGLVIWTRHGLVGSVGRICPEIMPPTIITVFSCSPDTTPYTASHHPPPSPATHLSLAIGPQPWADAVLADLSQLIAELCGQHVGEGHELRGLISGIAKHVSLVTSAQLLEGLGAHAVHGLANVRGLLLKVHQHLQRGAVGGGLEMHRAREGGPSTTKGCSGRGWQSIRGGTCSTAGWLELVCFYLALVAVEAHILGDEADLPARPAHDGLVVDLGLGGDLAKDHHHASLGGSLAGDLGWTVESCQKVLLRGTRPPPTTLHPQTLGTPAARPGAYATDRSAKPRPRQTAAVL